MRFRAGDRVMQTKKCSGTLPGKIYTVEDYINDSLIIGNSTTSGCLCQDFWKLATESEVTMKDAKYGVQYDRNGDPVEFFKTKAKATKRIEELLDDSEVDKKSIKLFTIGQVWEVKKQVEFELVKV